MMSIFAHSHNNTHIASVCPVERWVSYREKRENRRWGCAWTSNHTFHPRGILLGGTVGTSSSPFPSLTHWLGRHMLWALADMHRWPWCSQHTGRAWQQGSCPGGGGSRALSRMVLEPQWALLTATLQFKFPARLYTLQAPLLYISYSFQMSEEVRAASLSSGLLAGGGNRPMVVKMTYPQLCWGSRSGWFRKEPAVPLPKTQWDPTTIVAL